MYSYLKENQQKFSTFNLMFFSVPIIFKDPFLSNINVKEILQRLEKLIPVQLTQSLDAIYVGQFKHLLMRKLLASYSENVIYVNNVQSSPEKLILSIVHEFGHIAEDMYGMEIYGDKEIEKEFIKKRMWLYQFLKSNNFETPPIQDFSNIEQDEYFEAFLFEELGADMLLVNTANIFPSPYSVSNLREYFSIGFEKLFSRNSEEILSLQKMCPKLYKKIVELKNDIEGE